MDQFKVIVSAIILDGKTVLLGQRSLEEEAFPGYWGIPGGTVEVDASAAGENILEETIIRECREEMGIEVQVTGYVHSSYASKQDKAKMYLIFTAEHVSGTPKALEDTIAVQWHPLDKLPQNVTPTVKGLLKQIA